MNVRYVLPMPLHRRLAQRSDELLRVVWPFVVFSPANLAAENLAALLESSILAERLLPRWRPLDPGNQRLDGLRWQQVVLLIEVAGNLSHERLLRCDDFTDKLEWIL